MKVRDAIKMIETDGWYIVKTKGSHQQYKHHSKPGREQSLVIQTMIWPPVL